MTTVTVTHAPALVTFRYFLLAKRGCVNTGVSLRARLIMSFVAIIVGALGVAAIFGILRFDSTIADQAQSTADVAMHVASGLLEDELSSVDKAVNDTASDAAIALGDYTSRSYPSDLAQRANLGGLTYFALVSPSGQVHATSLATAPYTSSWEPLLRWAAGRRAASGLAIVPQAELETLGLAVRTDLPVKETPNGTVVAGEERGALAIVGVTPVGDNVLVGVKVLKLRHVLVDSIVEKVGGTATLFQGGVRISTTVRSEEGQRAVGTVVSDAVRQTTLTKGEHYRGEAFVVNREYLASYEPLRDIDGSIVGMLYVGVDKAPYVAATRSFALTFGAVVLAALGLALVGAFTVSSAMAKPLASMSEGAARMATGDLTVEVTAEGYREMKALGTSFNVMTGGLKTIIAQVDESVRHLRGVSGEISAASRASSENAASQASSVAQTTATLEELTRSFQSVADGARRVLHMAEDALESAQGGVSTVDRAHDAMDELAAGAHDMAAAASAMHSVTEEITEMTTIIGGIAGQTKILALNAAIEAARAGEAGKGFAVVSSEIRTLADNVAASAQRIAHMVTGIQEASTRLQKAASRQSSLSEATGDARQESRHAFGLIVQQMEDTTLAAREIAEATVQQTRASDQLVEVMQQVSVSSSEAAASARQLRDAASTVESEAESLLQGLTRFKTR